MLHSRRLKTEKKPQKNIENLSFYHYKGVVQYNFLFISYPPPPYYMHLTNLTKTTYIKFTHVSMKNHQKKV